jgi:aspartyl-tRNA synthetase
MKESTLLRTHSCGSLRKDHVGQTVTLAGWVNRRRDHGGLVFIDLRNRDGVVQIVFNPEVSAEALKVAEELRSEYVVQVTGEVMQRPAGTENAHLPTGDIEVSINEAGILNTALTPPFYINEEADVEETLRLKYRYLDLRHPRLRDNLMLRHQVVKFLRDYLDARDFVDVETPTFIKSTPEGARDYLVPSRLHPGQFYALPQSPQQLKQLLMVGGLERYYQMARCYRDEDSRADRQPEHTQLDVEMSFVTREDVIQFLEDMFVALTETFRQDAVMEKPFRRLTYAETMAKYASDKPDLRYDLEIGDISDIAERTEFGVFKNVLAAGGRVKGITAAGCGGYSKHELDELTKLAVSAGAGGLLTISLGAEAGSLDELTEYDVRSVAAKYIDFSLIKEIAARCNAKRGDLLLVVAGEEARCYPPLDALRRDIARRLGLAEPDAFSYVFIVDFPLMGWNEENQCWEAMNNPFTQPREEDLELMDTAPEQMHGRNYDLVCNGRELLSGSIRIHRADLQRRILELLGHDEETINELFGHMLEAFDYGAPPHGGFGAGIDRIIMCLAGEDNIRDVVAFPKTQSGQDLTLGSPSPVAPEQLRDVHIHVIEE